MTNDEPPTRRALASLAGVIGQTPGVASDGPTPNGDAADAASRVERDEATIDGTVTRDESCESGPTGDEATTPSDPVTAGAAAVRRGETRALVTAAEAATDDVTDAARFAAAGGFAHLAGAVAAIGTDDPQTAARGATVLVTLAAFRRATRGSDETRAANTDATASNATGVDDGSGMCVEPVREDE